MKPTKTKPASTTLSPVYSEALGRTVPMSKIGTVRWNGLVRDTTLAQHEAWQKANPGLMRGNIIDLLTTHALKTGFTIS